MQALESFRNGFWSARSLGFYQQPLVKTLLWLQIVPDTVFIVTDVLPLPVAATYGLFHMRARASQRRPLRKWRQRECGWRSDRRCDD